MSIKIVYGEDWQGFYINNILKYEDHEISLYDGLNVLCGYKTENMNVKQYRIDQDWLEERGSFPTEFNNIDKHFIEEF